MSGFSTDKVIGVEPAADGPTVLRMKCSIDEPGFCSELERRTIKRLRTQSGWWEGDRNALRVLREYAKDVMP